MCNRSFWWRFCVVTLLFGFFCRCRGFCLRTESYLVLFLLRIPVLQSKQVILIRSAPTYLRCIADQTRSKYDQPTLYRRSSRCIPAQHTICGERNHPRPFFNRLKNFSPTQRPLKAGPTNPRFILDQRTLSAIETRSLPIRPFFQSGG